MNLTDWVQSIGYYDETAGGKVRLLAYGETGCGKTTLAATFPKPFFIDTDKGGRTLKDKHIPHIALKRGDRTFSIIWDVLQKLAKKAAPFDTLEVETLVLDSLTSLADFLLVEAMQYPPPGESAKDLNQARAEWLHYGLIQNRMRSIVKFAQDLGLNVVATAGVKLERDEILGTFVGRPNIVGGYRDVVGHDFDEMFFLECSEQGMNKPPKYTAHVSKYRYFEAKSRDGRVGVVENPSYENLWKKEEKKA